MFHLIQIESQTILKRDILLLTLNNQSAAIVEIVLDM